MKTKSILYTALLLLLSGVMFGQNAPDIVTGEYFFNSKVDFGEGEPIAINEQNSIIDQSFQIDINGLPVGFHRLFVRFKDENGKWTQTYSYPVIVQRDQVSKIEYGEYFFDEKKTYGAGNPLNLDSISTVTEMIQQIDISGLDPGFHRLFVRFRDDQSQWSQTYNYPVIVQDNEPRFVVRGEYFFQGNTEYGEGYEIDLDSIGAILTVEDILTDGISELGPGDTMLYYRFQDNIGNWSHTYREEVCVNVVKGYYSLEQDPYCYGDSVGLAFDGEPTTNAVFQWDLDGDGDFSDFETAGESFEFVPDPDVSGESLLLAYRINSGLCKTSFQDTFDVRILAEISAMLLAEEVDCHGDCNGQIISDPSGGAGVYYFEWSNDSTSQDIDALCPGSYSVTITDSVGCKTTASAMVDEPDPLSITLDSIGDATAGASDGFIEISVSGGTPNYDFMWFLDGALISTEEDPSGLPSGTYRVEIVDDNGCLIETTVEIEEAVATYDATLARYVDIFPNPVSDRLNIRMEFDQARDIRLELIDNLSRTVRRDDFLHLTDHNLQWDVSKLPAGHYYLRILTQDSYFSELLMIIE